MANVSLIMTVIGPDHPGLVEALAARVAEHGGNWLESRMAHLGGQFAGIVQVEVDPGRRDDLVASLQQVEGLAVTLQAGGETTEATRTASLDLVGHDRPGIVSEISRALAAHGVNVEELVTEVASAPMAAGQLFKARAQLGLPDGLSEDTLRGALEDIAADLMVDVVLE